MAKPEQRPETTRWTIEPVADLLPGAMFRFSVLSDGTRHLDFMTRGCFNLWELDASALEQDMGSLWRMVDERDLPAMRRSIEDCARHLRDWVYQWRIRTPSGRTKWLHGSGRPRREPDGTLVWHVYVIDQTDNLQAQENLRESERRFRHLIDAIPNVAVQGYDEHLVCRYWNQASERLYGYRADEAVGASLLDLIIPPNMRPDVIEATRQMMATGEAIPAGELVLQRQDGSPVTVYSSHVYLQRPGQSAEFFCIDYDLTERQQAERLRLHLETQLRESQKMEALGTLAGGVAHDFNNIVAAILGNVNLALEDVPEDSPARESLAEIRKAGRRARDVVQQILTFSRRQQTVQHPTCLSAVVQEAFGLLRTTLPPDVQLHLHLDGDLPAVMANATQIEQVVLNLVSNAVQAVQDHPDATVHVRLERVDGDMPPRQPDEAETLPMDAPWPGMGVCLRVSDNGTGMSAETMSRIFEPFFTTKGPGEGTGLGLAMVHGILRDHKALLRIRSQPGSGTTFCVGFAGLPNATLDPATSATDGEVARPAGQSQHVLCVDDDASIGSMTRRLLEREGYQVTVCDGAAAALALLRDDARHVDLCITDLTMPGMSGLRLAREIKAMRPTLPILLVSGHISDAMRAEATRSGVDAFIEKPNSVETLFAAVHHCLSRVSSSHQATASEAASARRSDTPTA